MKFLSSLAFLVVLTAAQAGASNITLSLGSVYNGVSVDAASFGINGVFTASGSGAVASKVKIGDIKITKPIDTSTSKIQLDVANGTHIANAVIDFFKTGSAVPYEQLTLSDVVISSFSLSGAAQNELETFTLEYQKISYEYLGDPNKPPLGAFLPLSTEIQLGPFSFNYVLLADRLDGQLGNSDITSASFNFGSVPEPGTLALLGCGIVGMLVRRRKA